MISKATSMLACFTLLLFTPALAQESSRSDFEEFCEAHKGSWVGDIELAANMPGFGKQGDRITAYSQCRVSDDGNTMICSNQIGGDLGTWVVAYDAAAKRIRGLYSTSSGIFNQSITYRSEDGWVEEGTGTTSEGEKVETTFRIAVTDGGNTHTWSGELTVDGKAEKFPIEVWKRLASPTKADAKKAIDTLVGQWALTFEKDGHEKTAKVTAIPSSSGMALRVTYQETGEQPASGLFAWHSTKRQIVETWFRGGEHVRICFNGMTDDGALIGPVEGMLDGKRFAGIRVLKFHSQDHYTHTIRSTISEGEPQPELNLDAKRIVANPAD
ncbi:hypothetical protein NZK35_25260 [Stieleria sp. ICT_E10.1]|uniref:hypothetical protein n=1 Tax=Stieleria sedimenti TaxID=2976331 RepID=UPI0021806D6E|nr:hypothetical protein [Stieleria sedimenti]MCS7469973.1 hypothetical protein [Stieleria sedimenti]